MFHQSISHHQSAPPQHKNALINHLNLTQPANRQLSFYQPFYKTPVSSVSCCWCAYYDLWTTNWKNKRGNLCSAIALELVFCSFVEEIMFLLRVLGSGRLVIAGGFCCEMCSG